MPVLSQPSTADDLSLHVTHRGNNKMTIFTDDYDRHVFLRLLESTVQRFVVTIHAFVVMSTHHHLVVTPTGDVLPTAMKSLATRYTKYFNKRYARSGTIWGGRYRPKLVTDERYALTCLRYVEENPVRANIVGSPDQYRWSSYRAYARGVFPEWLTPHPAYLGLGKTVDERRKAYCALFATSLTDEELVEQRFR